MSHRLIPIIILCVCALCACTKKTVVYELWPDGAPSDNGITAAEYCDSVRAYNVTHPTLTVYRPAKSSGVGLIAIPGGGYEDVWHGTEGHNLAEWLNAQGIVYAVLKYRLPNGHPQVPLDDVQAAMALMRAHADEWHIDRLGVMGFSAGGHLAATAATHYTSSANRPDFQVLFYPVITMDSTLTHWGSRVHLIGDAPSDSLVCAYSLEHAVTADTPPALIFASLDDGLVPVDNSRRYHDALLAHGVKCDICLYEDGGHGWCSHTWMRHRDEWMQTLEAYLRQVR